MDKSWKMFLQKVRTSILKKNKMKVKHWNGRLVAGLIGEVS
jgi:hypothetical protein